MNPLFCYAENSAINQYQLINWLHHYWLVDIPYPHLAPARTPEWAANCTCCSTPWPCPWVGRSWPAPSGGSCVCVARPSPVRALTEDVQRRKREWEKGEWWNVKKKLSDEASARLSFAICKRPHYQTPVSPDSSWRMGGRASGGSLALGYSHRDCSRVPGICHNAYAASFQCWTARVCHSERWFITWHGRMARETTAGESTKRNIYAVIERQRRRHGEKDREREREVHVAML